MFKKLILNNFRSYLYQEFDFDPGINLLVGISNHGKSTVFRALNWVINNRPLGNSIVSYWHRDNKGNSTVPIKVQLVTDIGTVERYKSNDKNYYKKNDENIFEAFKFDVPEQIQSFLNMSDVNLQVQGERCFILSYTATEAAKYFNTIIGLDSIDKCLSYVKKEKSVCELQIKNETKEIGILNKDLSQLDWINNAELLYKKLEYVDNQRRNKDNFLNLLKNIIFEIKEIDEKLELIKKVDANVCMSIIKEIEDIKKEKEKIENDKNLLKNLCDKYYIILGEYENNKKELEKAIKNLPDICPFCGNPINKEIII